MSTVPLLINGEEIVSSSTFPVVSPVSGQTLYAASSASSDDTAKAITAASAAFPTWSKTKPIVRRNILLKAADLFEKYTEELKESIMQETGSDVGFAMFNMVTTAEHIRDTAGKISGIAGSIPVCQDENTSALVLKEPYGVILSIAPWNAPYILGARSVIFPLATGNTVVLKGSELSPRCFYHIGRIFAEAGLPAGALNIIYTSRDHSPAITMQLIEAPAIRKINFTGSTAIGSVIAAAAGRALKPCLLELGGKAAAIVLEDADIERAAFQCMLGAFLHAGQICMSTERIIVHKDIVDKFRPALQAAAAGFAPTSGPPACLAQELTVKKNRSLIAEALSKGAKLIHGDHTASEEHATRLRPLIVEGVTKEMELYGTESFGPSVSLIVVDSEDEAIRIANDVDYGLNSSVFTKDLARGIRVAKQLESGNVHINAMTVHDEASLPHGGVKKSGWGRFNGEWGLDEFLRIKTITFQN